MTTIDVVTALLRFVLVLPAIILHEVAHGWVANLLGDPTAKERGRLTLNPIAHMDIWGTVVMPIGLLLASGGRFAFGYAKPVPVNPYLLRRTGVQNGMLLVGIAGPGTNFVLALVSGIVARVLVAVGSVPHVVIWLVAYFTLINLILGFFNLIPIPPLDGSRVVQRFLSGEALKAYSSLEQYGFMIIIGLFILGPLLGIDPINAYFNVTVDPAAIALLGRPLIDILNSGPFAG
jgi:Zn-dependent protease